MLTHAEDCTPIDQIKIAIITNEATIPILPITNNFYDQFYQ